jgi:predicted amidohydrolase/ribosomal protein S18 acetylase RimI-like enzyme
VAQETEHQLDLRLMRSEDYEELKRIMENVYADGIGGAWTKAQFETLLTIFPDGQICIEDKGKIAGFVLSIIVDYAKLGDVHTYAEATGNEEFTTHTQEGDVLYGVDICVDPEYRGMRIGRRLYDARKELCEQLNLRSIIAGGRMPNYGKHSRTLKPKEYIEKVRLREIYDPVLSFQLSNDLRVIKILTDYLEGDKESKKYATLLEWNNIYYTPKKHKIGSSKTFARIGLVQWQMRTAPSIEAFFENVEFYVNAIANYNADFILFPELFNVPLMAKFNQDGAPVAIRKLAQYTEDILEKFKEFAVSYNINIIAGSVPLYENNQLFNVSYLCRRNGTHEIQYKIHITPSEVDDWGIVGGNKVKTFDTDVCKIGVLVCYDVEFPELARLLADEGMQILFVPFSTDSNNGYQRIRKCAEARAVENECYVAIAGSVGNLPKVVNMDIQYAQSAVFSPSDFAFPTNAVVAEATPNTEMILVADVDLDLLKELHTQGSVRNLKDRRTDLFSLKWK